MKKLRGQECGSLLKIRKLECHSSIRLDAQHIEQESDNHNSLLTSNNCAIHC